MTSVEVCRPTELDASTVELWRSFQLLDAELANPFLSPEFAQAADRARSGVRVAVVSEAHRPCAFLVFAMGPLGVAGPVAPGFTDLQGLVHSGEGTLPLDAVLTGAGQRGLRFDHLLASQVGADWAGAELTPTRSWSIDMPDGWDGYRQWALVARARHLKWMERKSRRFAVDHPSATFDFDTRSLADLSEVMRLKSAQCRQRGWLDIFASGWRRQMVEELSQQRSDSLTGTVSVLRVGESVVAGDFSLRSRRVYAGWQIAYDARLAQYSPGAVRWYHLLQRLGSMGPVTVDLGKGPDPFKERFSNGGLPLVEGMLSGGSKGTVVLALHRTARRGRDHLPGVERRLRETVQQWRRRRYAAQGTPREP